ncbi:helix-turn-helix domain-containing protein [Prauserella cavernicola]|uniref:MerR family transcriptional regulator n=1 Tax=Prauserella cavernicola TaxID=2800127 RepID=A0A934QPF5_9PSEU|nr:MerR family transcriptional regulator [Prauserella cavernicola]MBK1783737.1 MerR family transcriptional regulator [Prauserella cavernicola]
MAWSTRQLAELAGTTLKTVRYYHKIGLLDEPERAVNGYKRYQITHLIRLLRIRRLVDLGVPLSGIEAMGESEETAAQALRSLDAELEASIERQQRMRADLAVVLRQREMAELPPGFDPEAAQGPESERSLLLLLSRVLSPSMMGTLRELHQGERAPFVAQFDALPADANEAERQRLAERYLPEVARAYRDYPALRNLDAASSGRTSSTRAIVSEGLAELYNPAQLDVLRRLHVLLEREND